MKQVRAPNGMRMGSFLDSIEHNDEGDKYIFATSLIALIGFITDKPVITVANYLRNSYFSEKVFSYYHLRDKKCYSKDMHKEAHGFDLNTKELLAECYHSFGFSDRYMTFKREHELDFDFYYSKDELQAIDCIKDLNIDFSLEWEAERVQSKWNDEVEKPIFRLSDSSHLENLNDEKVVNGIRGLGLFRDKLIKLDTYSVLNAACLLSGDSPTEIHKFQDHLEFVQVFSDYVSFKLMIELAVKNNEVEINNDKILATGLKEYLGRNGYFFKGFNDFMAIEPAKPLNSCKSNKQIELDNIKLLEAQDKIDELENQLAQAKAELADKPADSITQSNTAIHNIKKEAIKQFNRSLATVLIDLDYYKGKLREGDIANYIVPYMKELAFVLADEQQDNTNNLTVTYDALYDNNLKNLGFKQGRQSYDEKQKVNIDLLFKKQLPITE